MCRWTASYVEEASPFLAQVLEGISNQSYPKSQTIIDVRLSPSEAQRSHERQVERWRGGLSDQPTADGPYRALSVATVGNASSAVRDALAAAKQSDAVHFMYMTSLAFINNTDTIRHLVEENRTAIAPVLSREGKVAPTRLCPDIGRGVCARSSVELRGVLLLLLSLSFVLVLSLVVVVLG